MSTKTSQSNKKLETLLVFYYMFTEKNNSSKSQNHICELTRTE